MNAYAILASGTVVNVVVCDDAVFATAQGWVEIAMTPGSPGIGWTTTDGGKTWVAPAVEDD